MTIKAVIFDLDGTLLHTLADLGDTVNGILEERGYPTHNLEKYKYFIGDGVKKLIERVLPQNRLNSQEVSECLLLFNQRYDQRTDLKTSPFPGVPKLLDELTARNISLNVLSNKPHELTLKSVRKYLGRWSFQIIFGQRDEVPRKPDPAGVFEILREISVDPDECLYLGDTSTDMITANAADVKSIGVTWGYRERAELEKNGALHIIEYPHELLNLLD